MAQLIAHNIDARHSTFNNVGRDMHYYNVSVTSARVPSLSQAPQSLSFNDAPIDLLSSYFTGRNDDLEHIEKLLGVTYGDTPTRCAVYGMQGMGKTQLGLQYAKLSYNQKRYSIIFWISGATVGKLNQGLAGVLTLIGHPDRDHQDQSTRLMAVRRWLEECGAKWLLVFDNVFQEVVSFLREHIPRRNSNGNILVTTRTQAVAEAVASAAGQQHPIFELRAPVLRDAAALLLREAGIYTSDQVFASANRAEDLVKCLGSLPLAISHVASFAKQSGNNLASVLNIYRSKNRYDLISWENDLSAYEQKSVAVTFATQLEELARQSPDSGDLLKVLSFFDPESIPLKMIAQGAEASQLRFAATDSLPSITVMPKSLFNLIGSPVQLQRAIQQLHSRSLVGYESNGDNSVLRIHDLIQITIQERTTSEDAHHYWFHVAVELVCSAFRQIHHPDWHACWAQCEVFAPHIQSLSKWDVEHSIGNSDLEEANTSISKYLYSRGRYGEAEMLFRRILAAKEKRLGPEHLDTLQIMVELADVYREQGRYHEAETLYGRALTGRERLHGSEHLETLWTVYRLAGVYREQEHYKEAETMYLRAFAGIEKLLGPEDCDTLVIVEGIAILYENQRRYSEAETLFKMALAGREKLLGPDNPDTLQTVDNLSSVYISLRRYGEAESLSKRALEGKEKALGPDHPSTLLTVANLADSYKYQGRYHEAEALYRRAQTGQENTLGPEHPETLRTVKDLADFFKQEGQL